jgi:hypothetical protein
MVTLVTAEPSPWQSPAPDAAVTLMAKLEVKLPKQVNVTCDPDATVRRTPGVCGKGTDKVRQQQEAQDGVKSC